MEDMGDVFPARVARRLCPCGYDAPDWQIKHVNGDLLLDTHYRLTYIYTIRYDVIGSNRKTPLQPLLKKMMSAM